MKNYKISTSIAGILLENPLLNASGCWDTTTNQLDDLMNSKAACIVTKSSTLQPSNGNLNPRFFINNLDTSINSIGFANFGVEYYSKYKPTSYKPLIQSIHIDNPKDLHNIINILKDCSPRLIELDIGCPNVSKEKQGLNWEKYELLLNELSYEHGFIWGVKLPPLFYPQDIYVMANLIQKSNASFITTINTIPNGLFVNLWKNTTRIYPNEGRGGIGGALIKPIGLANVQQFYQIFKTGRQIDIIGCGGINNAIDVMEYIICGAKAVQIGTQLLQYGPAIFDKIEKELSKLLDELNNNFSNNKLLSDFVGTLQIQKASL